MKHVLALYPGLAGKRAHYLAPQRWKLRLAGVRLILADEQIDAEERRLFRDALELPAPEDVAGGWERLERYLDSHRVDAVLAQSEPSLFLAGLAARHLGLPGPSLAGTLATTSKWQSRTRLAEAGLPQPRFALVRTAEDVRRFAELECGWPVVLKGVASTRQRLVTVVRGPAEVERAVAHVRSGLAGSLDVQRLVAYCALTGADAGCDPLREFLVESFATGVQLETEGLVQGGVPHELGSLEQVQRDDGSFFIDAYLLPAARPPEERAELTRLSARALAALGVDDTGYSVEFRAAGAEPTLIEVNGRLGWDEGLGELFAAAGCGLPAIAAAKLALGRRLGDLSPKRTAAVAYHSRRVAGVVRAVPEPGASRAGLQDRLRQLATRRAPVEWVCHVEPGDRVLAESDPRSRPHLLHAIATDPRSSERALAAAREAVDRLAERLLTTPAPASGQPLARDPRRLTAARGAVGTPRAERGAQPPPVSNQPR